MNHVILIGHVGADPDVPRTKTDKTVCSFSLATNGSGRGSDRDVHWHKIVAWERQAELCATYVTKGTKVAVAGRLQTRSFEDREGRRRTVTEVVAHLINFLDRKTDGKSRNSVLSLHSERNQEDDKVPF